jgi:hypothetical protein
MSNEFNLRLECERVRVARTGRRWLFSSSEGTGRGCA